MKEKSVTGTLAKALPILLFLAGFALFVWNEYRTARLGALIRKAEKECVELDLSAGVDPSMEGKLVHATGVTSGAAPLIDPDLGVEADAMVLKRTVSYFQLAEYHDNQTDQTTYYEDWCSSPLSSKDYIAKYRDANFVYVRLGSRKDTCKTVMLGAYGLQEDLVGWLRDYTADVDVSLPADAMAKLVSQADAAAPDNRRVKVQVLGNKVYIGPNPSEPRVGDVSVEYEAIPHERISVLAKIQDGKFVKYGAQKEYFIYQIVPGRVDASAILAEEKSSNSSLGWVLRGIALVLLVISAPGSWSVIKKKK